MPSCAVCTHDQRKAIDSALVSGKAVRRVATQHALTEASVRRHKHKHLASKQARVEAGRQASYLERIEAYLSEAQADLRACRESGEMRTLGSLHRPVFAALELIGVVGGEVPTGSQVTVNFFAKLGVRDEPEARGLIERARSVEGIEPREGAFLCAKNVARWLSEHPEDSDVLMAECSPSGAEVDEPSANGHA